MYAELTRYLSPLGVVTTGGGSAASGWDCLDVEGSELQNCGEWALAKQSEERVEWLVLVNEVGRGLCPRCLPTDFGEGLHDSVYALNSDINGSLEERSAALSGLRHWNTRYKSAPRLPPMVVFIGHFIVLPLRKGVIPYIEAAVDMHSLSYGRNQGLICLGRVSQRSWERYEMVISGDYRPRPAHLKNSLALTSVLGS